MLEINRNALELAEKEHEGQFRKFGGDPYIVHPKRVAEIVVEVCEAFEIDEPRLEAVAYLHDTLEDCDTRMDKIIAIGSESDGLWVLDQVLWVTDNKDLKGSRAVRKRASLMRLARAPFESAIVKLADRLDNVGDMARDNLGFFQKKYGRESLDLVELLQAAHPGEAQITHCLGDKIKKIIFEHCPELDK